MASLLASGLHADRDYRLPIPTLLVHGDGDGMGDIVDGTRAWAEREPLGLYVTIPDAGHASNQDNPEAFTAELAAFLDRELAAKGAVYSAPAIRSISIQRLPGGDRLLLSHRTVPTHL